MISVKTNVADFIATEVKEWNRVTKKATVAAMNKAAQQGRSEASRQIRQIYNVQAKGLNKKDRYGHKLLGYKRAKTHKDSSSIVARGRGIPLKYFSSRQTKKGVSVSVKKGKRSVIGGTFIATMSSGHKGVYVREKAKTIRGGIVRGKYKRRYMGDPLNQGAKRVGRLPIRELYGPGVAPMLNKETVKKKVVIFIRKKFPKLYQDAFNHFRKRR